MNEEIQFIIDTFNKEETFTHTPSELASMVRKNDALGLPFKHVFCKILAINPHSHEHVKENIQSHFLEELLSIFPHLLELTQETNNPVIQATVSDFLWRINGAEGITISSNDKLILAKQAYNGYINSFQLLFPFLMSDEDHPVVYELVNYLHEALFFLLKGNQVHTEEFVELAKRTLYLLQPNNGNHRAFFTSFTDDLFEHNAQFFKEQHTFIQDYDNICVRFHTYHSEQKEYDSALEVCRRGMKVKAYHPIKSERDSWRIQFAEDVLEAAKEFTEGMPFNEELLLEACTLFKEKKMIGKSEEALYWYERLSKQINSSRFAQMPRLKMFDDLSGKFSRHYAFEGAKYAGKYDVQELLNLFVYGYPFLSSNTYFFPLSKQTIQKSSKENDERYVLGSLFSTRHLNEKGNLTKSYTANTTVSASFHDEYRLRIESWRAVFKSCFSYVLAEEMLTTDMLIAYLERNSWFSSTLPHNQYMQGVQVPSHTEKLKPILENYVSNKLTSSSNYMLVIDSLALKFEGLLRDVLSFHQKPTISVMEDKDSGTFFTTEKDITALLRHPTIREVLTEDDHYLLTYVLVEKGGFNLRHNVSHSLHHQYDEYYADMLVLCLLRLSKYVIQSEGVCALPVCEQPSTN